MPTYYPGLSSSSQRYRGRCSVSWSVENQTARCFLTRTLSFTRFTDRGYGQILADPHDVGIVTDGTSYVEDTLVRWDENSLPLNQPASFGAVAFRYSRFIQKKTGFMKFTQTLLP